MIGSGGGLFVALGPSKQPLGDADEVDGLCDAEERRDDDHSTAGGPCRRP